MTVKSKEERKKRIRHVERTKLWTLHEVAALRKLYQTKTAIQIATLWGLTRGQIIGAIKRYGIFSGKVTRFKKGHAPWNKGLSVRHSPATEFRKGQLPKNTKHDGAISLRSRKDNGVGYYYIRLSLAKWIPLHHFNWIQAHGEIPKSHLLRFRDGNTLNCDLSNLELVARSENLRRNNNREKMSATMTELWRKEKLRKEYGMSAKTGLGRLINKK